MIAPTSMTSSQVASASFEELVDAYKSDGYSQESAETKAAMITDPPFPVD